ncbi:MAG: hypothetical protein C9356_15175 [Oleiphilus sp.]|nr:MAG: hypothetical protein C9356_15175 [Oleiphilus sp.]
MDTLIFFGVLFIGAYILRWLCIRAQENIASAIGYRGLMYCSFPGVVLHELSHALMCVVFSHRITEVRFFDPNPQTRQLGYVNHAWNPNSIFHLSGNFFIGIAPFLMGAVVVFLLLWSMGVMDLHQVMALSDGKRLIERDLDENYRYAWLTAEHTIVSLQAALTTLSWQSLLNWLIGYLLLSIILHAGPSKVDMQGAREGASAAIFVWILITFGVLLLSRDETPIFLLDWLAWLRYWMEITQVTFAALAIVLITCAVVLYVSSWMLCLAVGRRFALQQSAA